MPRKKSSGYFIDGEFIAIGSDLDRQLKQERASRAPSKTELKARSTELQKIGVQLCDLPRDRWDRLDLPVRLADALDHLAQITDFEAQRRQRQFVGKLMRKLNADEIEAIRALLERERLGTTLAAENLHQIETWRTRLLQDDDAMTDWARQFPQSELARIRGLVRQARKEANQAEASDETSPGNGAQRQGRSYRELFKLLRDALATTAT
jgi:ribosome-associated protein